MISGTRPEWRPAEKHSAERRSTTLRPGSDHRRGSYHPGSDAPKHASLHRKNLTGDVPPPPPPDEEEAPSNSMRTGSGSRWVAAADAKPSTTAAAAKRPHTTRRHTTRELISPRQHAVAAPSSPGPTTTVTAAAAPVSPTAQAGRDGTSVILDVRIPHIGVAKKLKFLTDSTVQVVIKETLAALVKATLLPEAELSRQYALLRRETDDQDQAFSSRRTVGELGLSIKSPVWLVRKIVKGDIFLDV
jgi:hypothetical protein